MKVLFVALALACCLRQVDGSKFKAYTTCEACTTAGFGWSVEKQRCGGFSNKVCPTASTGEACAAPAGFDPQGYAMFCLCHGRFGNKMEHLLGGLRWVHSLNRTLVLPSFDFMTGRSSTFYPFSDFFDAQVLGKFIKIITVEDFIKKFGKKWLDDGPRAYTSLGYGDWGLMEKEPMGTMWRGMGVTDFSTLERPKSSLLGWTGSEQDVKGWLNSYPPDQHPFLAMRETPGKFPSRPVDWELQKHLMWSPDFLRPVDAFFKLHGIGASGAAQHTAVAGHAGAQPYVAIHLRNGGDWKIACDRHVVGTQFQAAGGFFGSLQCLEEGAKIPPELCWPTDSIVISMAKEAIEKAKAKVLFVASDNRHMIAELDAALNAGKKKKKIKVVRFSLSEIPAESHPKKKDFLPQVDAAILARAKITIVNCVSTFSSSVNRERAALGAGSTWFWASDARP